ncbi:MAG: hypothetical protein L0H36_00200 [bacterium]|nr:hypothetical protein [bacterium]MDN5835038.1 hypothetical protein [bacterium]
MEKDFYCSGEIDAREDYNLFESLDNDSRRLFTDVLDSTLLNSEFKSSTLSDISCDQNGVYLSKRYDLGTSEIDENESSISKSLTIHYDRATRGLTVENYEVIVSYTINQLGVDKLPVVARYEISYYGQHGQSTVANVESMDLTVGLIGDDEAAPIYSSRRMTVYDCQQVLDELAQLDKVI